MAPLGFFWGDKIGYVIGYVIQNSVDTFLAEFGVSPPPGKILNFVSLKRHFFDKYFRLQLSRRLLDNAAPA